MSESDCLFIMYFFFGFSQTEHDRRLCEKRGIVFLGGLKDFKRLTVMRSAISDEGLQVYEWIVRKKYWKLKTSNTSTYSQSLDSLNIVGKHVQSAVGHLLDAGTVAIEVRSQTFDNNLLR